MTDAASPAPTWLSLLTADATTVDLDRHRDALLAAADGPAARERVQADAVQAATVRARLEEHRRQTRELAALNTLAQRLASLHDTHELLPEVAAQSRQLLGVDVAYIMVRQDDGTLRIESADGSMGSALRGIVLAEGEGVGGVVMSTGRPLWSESYLEDRRLVRVENLDAAALSEQLGGILGVPLQIGGTTIGVLFAADRRPRRFTEREVELLARMAAHAAVALRNAQLFGRHERAVAELEASYEALRDLDARRQRAATLREDLTAALLRGGGLAEVTEVVAGAVGRPVLVLDADGSPLASVQGAERLLPSGTPRADWFADSATVRREDDGHELVLTSVALRDGYAGCLVVAGTPGVPDAVVRLLEIGATSVALVVASERAVAEAELRTRGEFVNALLAPDVDEASIRRRARASGIELATIRAVAVLDPTGSDERAAGRLAQRLASDLRGWSAEHSGQIVLLVPTVDAATVRSRLLAVAEADVPAAVGVADCAGGTRAVRTAHESARQSAALLLALGRPRAVVLPAELGVYRNLFSEAGRGEIAAFVEATLGTLVAQDRDRGRDLVRTLAAYLSQAQHHARTCAELHVHANTLYHRLDRIEEVLGPDWRDPSRVLELQLALQLRALSARLTAAGSRPQPTQE